MQREAGLRHNLLVGFGAPSIAKNTAACMPMEVAPASNASLAAVAPDLEREATLRRQSLLFGTGVASIAEKNKGCSPIDVAPGSNATLVQRRAALLDQPAPFSTTASVPLEKGFGCSPAELPWESNASLHRPNPPSFSAGTGVWANSAPFYSPHLLSQGKGYWANNASLYSVSLPPFSAGSPAWRRQHLAGLLAGFESPVDRNPKQRAYLDAMRGIDPPIVMAVGTTGTGKTQLACAVGLEKLLLGQVRVPINFFGDRTLYC
jgi:hypothetical protein